MYQRVSGTGGLRLRLSPAMQVRRLEDPVSTPIAEPYVMQSNEDRHDVRIGTGVHTLRLGLFGGEGAVSDGAHTELQFYALEAARGYDAEGELWSPGAFEVDFDAAGMAALVASTEPWDVAQALTPAAALEAETQRRNGVLAVASRGAHHQPAAELGLAADQFVVTPTGRVEEAARARAEGDELRTVIAGYHWFTDWGRDTMISLEGLTLATGRPREAAWILRTFARYVRHGLIPNLFPEGRAHGLYHTADATLWYFQALHRYVADQRRPAHRGRPPPGAARHRRLACARHRFQHRGRSCRRPAAPGAGGIPADLDGRQGRRLGGDAAPRQGGRDPGALVQRAALARDLVPRGAGRHGGGGPVR